MVGNKFGDTKKDNSNNINNVRRKRKKGRSVSYFDFFVEKKKEKYEEKKRQRDEQNIKLEKRKDKGIFKIKIKSISNKRNQQMKRRMKISYVCFGWRIGFCDTRLYCSPIYDTMLKKSWIEWNSAVSFRFVSKQT